MEDRFRVLQRFAAFLHYNITEGRVLSFSNSQNDLRSKFTHDLRPKLTLDLGSKFTLDSRFNFTAIYHFSSMAALRGLLSSGGTDIG